MKTICNSVVLLAGMFTLGGCASIVSGGPQALPVLSTPAGATCEVIDAHTGTTVAKTTTPDTLTLKRDAGFFRGARYRMRFTREGYLPYETQVDAGVNGWYFGNLLFGGLPGFLLIDPATGAMWKIHEEQVNAVLHEDSAAGREEQARAEMARQAALAAQKEVQP